MAHPIGVTSRRLVAGATCAALAAAACGAGAGASGSEAETTAALVARDDAADLEADALSHDPRWSSLPGVGMLRADGGLIKDAHRTPIALRGANLGSWLLLETWMTELPGGLDERKVRDEMDANLATPNASQTLMDTYQQNFITEADFIRMHDLGMNVVRIPFVYWFFESDAHPGVYRPAAFALLDSMLLAAARHGIYAILDFHGAPGGQSTSGDTGEARTVDAFWDRSTNNQARFIDLWKAIASHYQEWPVVAGYDLLNEPAEGKAQTTDDLVDVYDRTLAAIRRAETSSYHSHLAFMERIGNPCNFAALPQPSSLAKMREWENWSQSDHLYPQWCKNWAKGTPYSGSYDTAGEVPDGYLDAMIARVHRTQDDWALPAPVPVYIGEFGWGPEDGLELLGKQMERFNASDLSWTIWSYKTWFPTNWGVVHPAGPIAPQGAPHHTPELCSPTFPCPLKVEAGDFAQLDEDLRSTRTDSAAFQGVTSDGFRRLFATYGASRSQ